MHGDDKTAGKLAYRDVRTHTDYIAGSIVTVLQERSKINGALKSTCSGAIARGTSRKTRHGNVSF